MDISRINKWVFLCWICRSNLLGLRRRLRRRQKDRKLYRNKKREVFKNKNKDQFRDRKLYKDRHRGYVTVDLLWPVYLIYDNNEEVHKYSSR